ncbi:hypothetical protein GB937_000262 [Aspergillus fischeri]|nr:hypothetical protein GB937_000262 [Aspergillus fischeri]
MHNADPERSQVQRQRASQPVQPSRVSSGGRPSPDGLLTEPASGIVPSQAIYTIKLFYFGTKHAQPSDSC